MTDKNRARCPFEGGRLDAGSQRPMAHARNSENSTQKEDALMVFIRLVPSVESPDSRKFWGMLRNAIELAEKK